jgi:DNA-binding NarL/FixJ family response regulator
MTAATLDVLVIEDDDGYAHLVEAMLASTSDLLHRIDLDGTHPESAAVHHVSDLAAGVAALDDGDVDVVVLDLGLPDSSGLETLDRVVAQTEFTPVVVLTGLDDRDRGIKAIQSGAKDYLVKSEVTGELLVHAVQYAIERSSQERERVRHRERLEALNHLNEVTQAITHDVITTSTRESLERAVCDRLVEHDGYPAARVCDVDRTTGRPTTRERARAAEDPPEDPTGPMQGGAEETAAEWAVATAARTGTVQVVPAAQDTDGPRQDAAQGTGETGQDAAGRPSAAWQSLAAVPLGYRSVRYGVLVVAAVDPEAFGETEAAILGRLGDVIGHAMTAIDRREALVHDTTLQLKFEVADALAPLVAAAAAGSGTLAVGRLIPGDDGMLAYGHAEGVRRDELQAAAASAADVGALRLLSPGEDCYEFELETALGDGLASVVASHGGHLSGATVDGDGCRIVAEFPPGRDAHTLVGVVQDHCASATPHAKRTVQRDAPGDADPSTTFTGQLTEKQDAALEAAFRAGYFDWPRGATGEEVGDRLGVSQATFSQHLRAAERSVFDAVFEDDPGGGTAAGSPWTSLAADANSD